MSYPGPQPTPPLRLSIGASPAAKIAAIIVGIVGVSIAAFFVGVTWFGSTLAGDVASGFGNSGVPGDASGAADTATTVFRALGLCAVPIVAVFAFVVLSALRRAAWLDGTVLTVRNALSTRRVDLSTASVQGDAMTYRQSHVNSSYVTIYTVPALAARDRRTGVQVKIPLRGMGLKRLPSGELNALADAMMRGRAQSDPEYATAAALATSIRQMAANPFPV